MHDKGLVVVKSWAFVTGCICNLSMARIVG